jgi:2Fe-2S ferredoxin
MDQIVKPAVSPAADDEDRVLKIRVRDHEGTEHVLDGLEGWRVMEVIRDWGVGIKAECGGACACGTCHCKVDPEWLDQLVPPSDEELDQLDQIWDAGPTSRLSCQILLRPELDGLTLSLASGSAPD